MLGDIRSGKGTDFHFLQHPLFMAFFDLPHRSRNRPESEDTVLQRNAALRKRSAVPQRQKRLLGLFPVPGTTTVNPPVHHHGVDLSAIQKKIALNRAAIDEGRVIFPGLGVSKHPMTVETSMATYVIGWASRGGVRPVSLVDGSMPCEARILFLRLGEPMVFAGPRDMLCITAPVLFVERRHYEGIAVPALWSDEPAESVDFQHASFNFADLAAFSMRAATT